MNKKEIEQKHCYFCQRGIEEIDYKNINSISKGISSFKKILPRQKNIEAFTLRQFSESLK